MAKNEEGCHAFDLNTVRARSCTLVSPLSSQENDLDLDLRLAQTSVAQFDSGCQTSGSWHKTPCLSGGSKAAPSWISEATRAHGSLLSSRLSQPLSNVPQLGNLHSSETINDAEYAVVWEASSANTFAHNGLRLDKTALLWREMREGDRNSAALCGMTTPSERRDTSR